MNSDNTPIDGQANDHSDSSAMGMAGRILLIDDDDIFRRTLTMILAQRDFQVSQARDGHEAIAIFCKERHDVVICDIFMPSMEGLETISALRRIDPRVKIIAISGGGRIGSTDLLKVAQRLGAFKTLLKPFESEELFRSIADAWPGLTELKQGIRPPAERPEGPCG